MGRKLTHLAVGVVVASALSASTFSQTSDVRPGRAQARSMVITRQGIVASNIVVVETLT